jgi:hypothetical protein
MAYKFNIPTLRYPSPGAGEYIAEVKTVTGKNRDGEKLISRNGDPKLSLGLLLVGKDGLLYEMSEFVTLPTLDDEGNPVQDTGVYLLRRLSEILRALGHDMSAGESFEINSAAFLGRTAKITIGIGPEVNGKSYPQIKLWELSPRAAQASGQRDDEIPF